MGFTGTDSDYSWIGISIGVVDRVSRMCHEYFMEQVLSFLWVGIMHGNFHLINQFSVVFFIRMDMSS